VPLTLRTLLVCALVSGALAGVAFFAVQSVTTRPLIAQAEVYERAASAAAPTVAMHEHGAGGHEHAAEAQAWEPADGIERTAYTLAATVLIGIGYAFLLVGAIGLSGRAVTIRSGLAWGAAGFLAFFAAPSLGLPPEPPGAHAADLLLRQEWWLGTVAATCAGLWLLAFQNRVRARLVGLILLVIPHLVGAPHVAGSIDEHPELSANFVWAALAANAALWLTLGLAVGTVLPRLGERGRLVHSSEAAG
jgi:cobalt transporter subunit CbtA